MERVGEEDQKKRKKRRKNKIGNDIKITSSNKEEFGRRGG